MVDLLEVHDIEKYEIGETAVLWHAGKFIITDFSGKSIASLRLVPGDEVTILEGFDRMDTSKYSRSRSTVPCLNYRAMFRHARGYISSACIKHKDESKNIGEYMHTRAGFTI
jgi:hypothetical protein